MTPRRLFGVLAFAEAVTWTLLITALVLRAVAHVEWAVGIAGGIHGFVFLSYGATVVLVALNNRWKAGPTAVALISAVVPYATIPAELWADRRGLLAGSWRTDATADAGVPACWYDRPLAWFLARPALLIGGIAVAVVAVYSVLLILGPPGGTKA